ncbi:hypothetical protein EJ05DRAFT_506888 [Pseudovirgaria hyperparasitica]|uniref:Glycosyltransferase family 8 protein n=1 Tax=Pseudovirgaria hyperparasitica TaxID=470096 RepID=A0A6A6WM36_9PEZI|nr:uncharacterized protein EJ05DRAFT_506888 [Pseudovirgaria hyperparasitica]KAF2763277.1 hypothetical protein EJ05DRAFT_506888 [Pseudovirgaria hyperparasitica]
MVLLTGGQVSMAISSAIVVLFTGLLFLAGYILQQQTVQSLQIAVRPRIPKPLAPPASLSIPRTPLDRIARVPGSSQDIDNELQHYLSIASKGSTDWSKLAHVQLVRTHEEVCTAVMFFAELKRLKSPARRVLMFPASWTRDMSEDESPSLPRTRRLLRTAARRYNVGLRAVGALGDDSGKVDANIASNYSLSSLWAFGKEFDRVLYMQSPGLLLDSEPLDGLLAFAPTKKLSAIGAENEISMDLLLIQPDLAVWNNLKDIRAEEHISDIKLLRKTFSADEALLRPSSYFSPSIVADTASLRLPIDEFNATAFLDKTAYLRFTDPEIPGPEYDIPYVERANYRPAEDGPRLVWDRLYEVFRQRRMDVCGLDLEHWKGPKGSILSEPAETVNTHDQHDVVLSEVTVDEDAGDMDIIQPQGEQDPAEERSDEHDEEL